MAVNDFLNPGSNTQPEPTGYPDTLAGVIQAILDSAGGGGGAYTGPSAAQSPATLGQKAMAASLAVAIASDQSRIPVMLDNVFGTVTSTFTRPNDTVAYTAPSGAVPGDLVANNVTAGSVAFGAMPLTRIDGGAGVARGQLNRLDLREAALKAGHSIRVHILIGSVAPAFTTGNNAAIAVSNLGANLRELGFVDLLMVPGVSGTYGVDDSLGIGYSGTVGTDNLYFVPEALTAFTGPAAPEVWTFTADLNRFQ